jgi:ATP adenylyltransferase
VSQASSVIGQRLLTAAMRPDGFNLGFNLGSAVAGGSIAHLHGHIVPRWNGDSNFMPVIGQTRILPQSLAATWDKISAAATTLGGQKTEDRGRKSSAKPRKRA